MTHILRYVPDVASALEFYERAFGLDRVFLHEGGDYGELETGATKLAFAADELIESHGLNFRTRTGAANADAGEVGFECDDIQAAFEGAVAAGATALLAPTAKPWGQTIAYLADPWGHLIALGQWTKT